MDLDPGEKLMLVWIHNTSFNITDSRQNEKLTHISAPDVKKQSLPDVQISLPGVK
jgi:hypothetical protein